MKKSMTMLVALLPIGDKFTMGPFEAALASMWLNPKVVIPMHYNTFPPVEQDPAIFANFVSQFNPNIDVVVMNPDEYFKFNPEEDNTKKKSNKNKNSN